MVDPFREQNPKKRIWSFVGTGAAGNNRIDRIYVNSINMKNVTDMRYIQTSFKGHRILAFNTKGQQEHGKGYYKMNASILKDERYKDMVEETIKELEDLQIDHDIEKWDTFILTIKFKSISYSQNKNRIK